MAKLSRVAVVVCLWSCLQTHSALACRYNVRDIGFVDLGTEPYYLYGYVRQDTPVDITSGFKKISSAGLMESNIKSEIINIDRQKNHPATKYLEVWRIESFPAAVLVSAEGRSLPISLTKPGQPFEQSLWSALDEVLCSPKRKEILQKVSTTYGVVLLIEGADAEENKSAKVAASGAVETISMQMKMMPKPISHPPALMVIDLESLSREKVLLWSLGLDTDKVNKPYAAVLYGRARLMGALLKGEEITKVSLANILSIIGLDCECGLDLDRRWILGMMLPVRWGEDIQAGTAKTLGFDPENPMVKMEISQILRHSLISSESPQNPNYYPSVPFGYREIAVEFNSAAEEQQNSAVQIPNTASPASGPKRVSESSPLADSYLPIQNMIFILIGLIILVLISGVIIFLRSKRRWSKRI